MWAARNLLRGGTLARRGALAPSVRRSTVNAYLAKVGLDDWKRQLPLGIILAIPIIQNEVLILSEETQLVGCFCLFCGTAYQLGAESIAEMLDAKTKSVIAQHNAVEEQAIGEVKVAVEAHKKRIETLKLLKSLPDLEKETNEVLNVAKAMEFKHATRDKFVKMLDNLVAKDEQTKALITAGIIADAAAAVTASFDDAQIRDQALAEAISILKSGGKAELVPALFSDYFKTCSTNAKDNAGQSVSISPHSKAEIEEEIAAIIKRDGIEPTAKVQVPDSFTA